MGMATSLVALALLGADVGPPASAPTEPGEPITCQMRMTTVEGLGWRSVAYPRLNTVGQKGASTIWTADRKWKASLGAAANGQLTTVQLPKVTALPDQTATITRRGPFQYIGDVERIADGPINGAKQVKFAPKGASIEVGFTTEFSARRIDQGVLAKVKVAESHIGTIHQIGVTEVIHPDQDDASTALTDAGKRLFQAFVKGDPTTVSTPLMVPEVASTEVAGEWLVPHDSILIVSLGIDTITTAGGKTVTQERLAIYDFARPGDEERTAQATCVTAKAFQELVAADADCPEVPPGAASVAMTPACRVDTDQAVAIAFTGISGLSMPSVPDRSLPEAINSDGEVFELPPLPETYAANDLDQIKPGSPLASPQAVAIARPAPMIADPQLARTSLEAIPDHEIENFSSHGSRAAQPISGSDLRWRLDTNGLDREPPVLSRWATQPEDPLVSVAADHAKPFAHRVFSDIVTPADMTCPAQDCPYSAAGCDAKDQPATAPHAARVEMGVSVRDKSGACVYNSEDDLVAALKNPGKVEVKYIPLGGMLSLEIQAKVVGTPSKPADSAQPAAKASLPR